MADWLLKGIIIGAAICALVPVVEFVREFRQGWRFDNTARTALGAHGEGE